MTFRAPVSDILFSMTELGAIERGIARGLYPDLADGATGAVLAEAGRVAEDLLLPLDRIGDRTGVSLRGGVVSTTPGWPAAYQAWRAGGWNGVVGPIEHGGLGLPTLLNAGCLEIWSSANAAFALGALLTVGAVEAIRSHGSDALRALYLPRLVSGEWTGTMNLTEPQAGSDLGALRTRAEPAGDGTYRITGQKIYITYGDHDMTSNIVHLVLARLPDAPAGTRGISLFLVPKFMPDRDGNPGVRNDVFCAGLEHKLGMHASPTCTMVFGDAGGATGWLVGAENKGLACMFTMMNNARLAVGLQGVAAAERATQQAIAFAKTRRQGRGTTGSASEASAIVEHPDVARMLLTMKAETAAARAICHLTAAALDGAARGLDDGERRRSADRAALLTPVAKAYSTDVGIEVASLGLQVHGGMGYVEDTGAAQILRDVRIAAIYEGTNGIQAIDLATRKLQLAGGTVVAAEIADMRARVTTVRESNVEGLGAMAERLGEAVDALEQATAFMLARPASEISETLLGATNYLRVFGIARGGTALASLALAAADGRPAPAGTVVVARFYAEQISPAAQALAVAIVQGGRALEGAKQLWPEG